jgi:hypothetical protein
MTVRVLEDSTHTNFSRRHIEQRPLPPWPAKNVDYRFRLTLMFLR